MSDFALAFYLSGTYDWIEDRHASVWYTTPTLGFAPAAPWHVRVPGEVPQDGMTLWDALNAARVEHERVEETKR
jgi:hypothetical protein